MNFLSDYITTYRRPSFVFRRKILTSNEATAFAYLIFGCLLLFFSQFNEIINSRNSIQVDTPMIGIASATFFGTLIVAPLFFYLIAALIKILTKPFGLRISWLASRIVLFWSLLLAAPWTIVSAVIMEQTGNRLVYSITSFLVFIWFVFNLIVGYREAARNRFNP